jgi:hypothetical protein
VRNWSIVSVELVAAGLSILLGIVGYLLGIGVLELRGLFGTVFSFGLLVARALLGDRTATSE